MLERARQVEPLLADMAGTAKLLRVGSQGESFGEQHEAAQAAAVSAISAVRKAALAQTTRSFYTFVDVIDCHSRGIYTLILLSVLSFSVKMTVSPRARQPSGSSARWRSRRTRRSQPASRASVASSGTSTSRGSGWGQPQLYGAGLFRARHRHFL